MYLWIYVCIYLFYFFLDFLDFIHLFIYSFIHLFIYSFIHLFIYSFIHLFIYSFIHLLIYAFIHLFIIHFPLPQVKQKGKSKLSSPRLLNSAASLFSSKLDTIDENHHHQQQQQRQDQHQPVPPLHFPSRNGGEGMEVDTEQELDQITKKKAKRMMSPSAVFISLSPRGRAKDEKERGEKKERVEREKKKIAVSPRLKRRGSNNNNNIIASNNNLKTGNCENTSSENHPNFCGNGNNNNNGIDFRLSARKGSNEFAGENPNQQPQQQQPFGFGERRASVVRDLVREGLGGERKKGLGKSLE